MALPVTKFEVSAPGKLILHGEHSVVYGWPAVAGPIGLRTYLTYTALERSSTAEVVLRFDSIDNYTARLTLDSFGTFLREVDCNEALSPEQFLQQMRTGNEFPFARFIHEPVLTLAERGSKQWMSLGAALYLLNRVLRSEGVLDVDRACVGEGGFEFRLRSTMSIGAGLGSSASYGVSLAAGAYVFSRILHRQFDPAGDGNGQQLLTAALPKISQWAFDSEVIMHEKPSGIDNTIAAYGELIRFRRGDPDHHTIALRHPLHVLIVDTCVSRSTAQLVTITANRRQHFPRTIGSILEAMGGIVEEAIELLESSDHDQATVHERLGTLVTINNNLLRSLGTSHPSLERIFALADRYGFASKLTGAGGGGCAFILLPDSYRELDAFRQLQNGLAEAGFVSIETTISGGTGVTLTTFPTSRTEG
ncbi:uncharacterized protein LOC128727728 [Anopheles nili]|uniref:uncharacterized protein LOC128727728 n=1 Tax=Anopheles nili TaxID=185578 RepID=UPI00237C1B88|nr:uncharacterized protein LOC128727728 [Anopheles nili]